MAEMRIKWPEEGVVTAKIADGRIKLLVGSPTGKQQLVFEVEAPPGVTTVFDHYVSERAPNLFGFWLMGNDDAGDRNNGFVAFRRLGPLQYQLVAWLPPLEPNPVRSLPARVGAPHHPGEDPSEGGLGVFGDAAVCARRLHDGIPRRDDPLEALAERQLPHCTLAPAHADDRVHVRSEQEDVGLGGSMVASSIVAPRWAPAWRGRLAER